MGSCLSINSFNKSQQLLLQSSIQPYTIKGKRFARITKIYDGDTFTANILDDTTSQVHSYKVRLLGIDSPEIKDKQHSQQALISRGVLAKLCTDCDIDINKDCNLSYNDLTKKLITNKKIILLDCQEHFDKYGRVLATVFVDDLCINQYMINNQYAKAYII